MSAAQHAALQQGALDNEQLCDCLHGMSLHVQCIGKACAVLKCASLSLQESEVIFIISH